ncbi:MAG: HAMP domain-containing sensor histidine kinase [Myxococcota bacterium]
MIWHRLYIQICVVVAVALLAFAVLANLLWANIDPDRYYHAIFEKTTALATLLLPPIDAPADEQQRQIESVSAALDFGITVWAEDGRLIAASAEPARPPTGGLYRGVWTSAKGETQFATLLPDGRRLVIDLDRLAVPSDSAMFGIALALLAVFIVVIMYPFIRSMTRRLERLQGEVERIGSGNLGARVDVQGRDEIAKLAGSFNNAAQEIEKLVTAQRLLLANASHELRTPLARIRLGIEMLSIRDDPGRRSALQRDIGELDDLINELILMTRLDTGLGHPDFQPVDLVAVVAEECARYRGCSFEGTASELSGDRRMLQHLVRNLIDNAHTHGAPPVQVQLLEQGGVVSLTVTDAGPGIPEDQQDKVLKPFYRATNKQNVPGYGLGLALVQKIAETHGGSVSIQTTPKSAISVSFPTRLAAQAA